MSNQGGLVNIAVFTSWVAQILLPNLPKESVVVMDNASFYKDKDMQKMLEDSGYTLLYLLPYSPDLNPIEKNGLRLNICEEPCLVLLITYSNSI